MKWRYLIFIFLVMLALGCSNTSSAILTKVNKQNLSGNAKRFIEEIRTRNGLFLYSSVNEKQYIIINYSNIILGQKAKYLSSVKAHIQNQTLVVNLDEEFITNDQDQRVGKLDIFEIGNDNRIKNIQILIDGKETTFDLVSG